MNHRDDLPEDLSIPDELMPVEGAVRAMAHAITPRQGFLDALDARVQREATGHTAAPLVMPIDRPMPQRRAAAPLGRRRFLIGSAAAAVGALFVGLQGRKTPVLNIPATQQAARALISANMVAAAPPATATGSAVTQPSNLDFTDGIASWGLYGSNPNDYAYGFDANVKQHGSGSGYLRARVPDPSGFGTLARTFTPDPYRGKRIRMTSTVKADAVDDWAGLWMRVDGPQQQALSFDNMQGRPITGTRDWQTYEIVLDVPQESALLAFGILLVGKGGVWLNDVTFDSVGPDVPTTDALSLPDRMQNLDFETGTTGWFLAGDRPQEYRIGVDTTAPHGGKASGYLRSNGETHGGFGTLMQMTHAGAYPGTRVRMSGWVKTSNVDDWAGLWMRVDGPDAGKTQHSLSFDNMQNRPIKGTSDWTRHEIVLDVPPNAAAIAFGILLQGKGQVWLDDLQFVAVGLDVPTTNLPITP